MMLPTITPMELIQQPSAFDHPEWLFEVKFDGFRAMAYIQYGECKLVSRKGVTYNRFKDLSRSVGQALDQEAIIDCEIVCLDDQGRSQFYDLMFNRAPTYLYAFDLVWLDGEDLRDLPLVERKEC